MYINIFFYVYMYLLNVCNIIEIMYISNASRRAAAAPSDPCHAIRWLFLGVLLLLMSIDDDIDIVLLVLLLLYYYSCVLLLLLVLCDDIIIGIVFIDSI